MNDNPMMNLIPPQLRGLSTETKAALKTAYGETSFTCSECGGDMIPFSIGQGVCLQCSTVESLSDCDYEDAK